MPSISGLKDFKKGYVLPFIPGYSLGASSPSGAAYCTPSATRAVVEDGPSTQGMLDSLKNLKDAVPLSDFDELVAGSEPVSEPVLAGSRSDNRSKKNRDQGDNAGQ